MKKEYKQITPKIFEELKEFSCRTASGFSNKSHTYNLHIPIESVEQANEVYQRVKNMLKFDENFDLIGTNWGEIYLLDLCLRLDDKTIDTCLRSAWGVEEMKYNEFIQRIDKD